MRDGRAKIGLFLAAAIAVTIAWLIAPADALARGWLAAFAAWSGFPIGSLVLVMIHRLVGGRWGEALAPVLRPAAIAMPLVMIVFLPVAVALWRIYPWATDPGAAPPSVARLYLNPSAFLALSAAALAGWAILGVVFGRGGGGPMFAGLGLTFYGLMISLVSVAWYLSPEPHYVSTAFGAMIAIQQLLTALAVGAVLAPMLTERTAGDIGGLLIATLLGVVYLELMTFIVDWYGNLPNKAAWYLKREQAGWELAIGAAMLLAALSFALLLKQKIRRSPSALRIVGILILTGIAVHTVWLIVPAFQAQPVTILAAFLCGLGLVCATLAVGSSLAPFTQPGPAHAS